MKGDLSGGEFSGEGWRAVGFSEHEVIGELYSGTGVLRGDEDFVRAEVIRVREKRLKRHKETIGYSGCSRMARFTMD